MTAEELRDFFNDKFALGEWPLTYEVDHETYANVCQATFDFQARTTDMFWDNIENGSPRPDVKLINITIGPRNGIHFRNIELILKSREVKE